MKNFATLLICGLLCMANLQRAPAPKLPGTNVTVTDKDLFDIVKNGEVIDLIGALAGGEDVNLTDEQGMSLLHHAAEAGRDDMVAVLKRHEANTSMLDNANRTALQLAQEKQHTKVIDVLQDSEQTTQTPAEGDGCDNALHLAALAGDIDEVKRLLGDGADVNGIDKLGRSALHYAALKGNEALVNLLLENNANLSIQDNFGNTAATAAQFANQPKIVSVLTEWQEAADKLDDQADEKAEEKPAEKADEKNKALRDKALQVRGANKTCPRQWQ